MFFVALPIPRSSIESKTQGQEWMVTIFFCTIESENLSKMKNCNFFFLQFNLSFPNEYNGKLERILGFGKPSFRCLGGNGRIFIDGTFKIVPKPLYQCLIIMVFDKQTDSFVPVFYVLMTSKTEQIYRIALFWIKFTTNYKMRPLLITCDFEKALYNAISVEFPPTFINGCLFIGNKQFIEKLSTSS